MLPPIYPSFQTRDMNESQSRENEQFVNNSPNRHCVVGIDATNLRRGGGRTHLIELLRAANPVHQGVLRVVVWGAAETLALLDERDWLEKAAPSALEGGVLRRIAWQRFSLSDAARRIGCDVLFVPGGSYAGHFKPVVTMSRNMLPFEWTELKRYIWSPLALKLILLRWMQSKSFRHADGLIFLTKYARREVLSVTGAINGADKVIPHGLSDRFRIQPRPQRDISAFSVDSPFRLLYVSIIDQYKHQWHIVDAIAKLRLLTDWPLSLDLVGPSYGPAMKKLLNTMNNHDPAKKWIRYHGPVPYDALHTLYDQADLGIFASSCENMPNILLETMAAGLPVACSDRGPMPEVLGNAGIYFNPEKSDEIMCALYKLIDTPTLRIDKANASYTASCAYNWQRCADETFSFLAQVAAKYHESSACARN